MEQCANAECNRAVGCSQASSKNPTLFFSNKKCAYFPCHEGIDPDNFNCLFCYCPLYALSDDCGGDFTYTASGYKDCSKCTVMHEGERGVQLVTEKYLDLATIVEENRKSA